MGRHGLVTLAAGVLALVTALIPSSGWAAPRPWDVLEHDTPAVLWAGIFQTVHITVQNVGSGTWSESTNDHLAYHWRSATGEMARWDGQRTWLGRDVAPGEVVELEARVQPPMESGRWILEWEMVREGGGWYGPPAGGPPLQVRVLVVRRHAVLQTLFFAVVLGAALGMRRLAGSRGYPWGYITRAVLPLAVTWLGIALVVLCFSELALLQLREGTWPLVLGAAALLCLPVALVPVRARAWVAFALLAVVTFIAVADLAYLRFFGTVVPVVAAAAVNQVGQIEGSIFALLRLTDVWLVGAALAALVSALLAVRWRRLEQPGSLARRVGVAGAAACCLLGAWPAVKELTESLNDPSVADQLFSQEKLVTQWGVANVHLFDIARTTREWWASSRPSEEDRQRVEAYLSHREPGAARRHPLFGVAAGANLVLVQVESLQEWVVEARVGSQPVMPYVSSLLERGQLFTNVFDQSGQGRSSDGEFITLNSLHSLDRGAVVFRRPHNQYLALPQVLRGHGYSTLSAHPFDRGFWNRASLHPVYGFDRMFFRRELGPGEVIGWGLADEPFFARMLPELRAARQPFMAFLITLGLHHPFDQFPERHKVLDVGSLANTPLGNYIQAMHYFDTSFEKLMKGLEAAGLLENTVVALYGDHEAGLGVDANVLRLAGLKEWDPSTPARLQKVPFVVILPHRAAVGRVETVGGQIDIAPTLLTYLGVAAPPSFLGRPLGSPSEGFAVLNSGTAVAPDRIYVARGRRIDAGGMCFDFPSGRSRPRKDCSELEARGREQLGVSRWVVLHDQVGWVAGLPTSPPGGG